MIDFSTFNPISRVPWYKERITLCGIINLAIKTALNSLISSSLQVIQKFWNYTLKPSKKKPWGMKLFVTVIIALTISGMLFWSVFTLCNSSKFEFCEFLYNWYNEVSIHMIFCCFELGIESLPTSPEQKLNSQKCCEKNNRE